MTSCRLAGSVALVLAVLIPRGSAEAAKPHSAERFSVRLSVESGGSMVVTETVRFASHSVATDTPGWQRNSMQTWKTAPLFLGIAGLVLFGGLFGFTMFAMNHRVSKPADHPPDQTTPPDNLPVALAGTLAGARGDISWANSIGTLFDLARRGVVQIKAPDNASRFNRRDCAIVLLDRPRDLREHERTLVDVLFTTSKGPRDTVRLSQLGQTFMSGGGWKRFTRAVTAELHDEGLLDDERQRARNAATRVGLGLVVAALVGLGVALPFVDRIGAFALTIPGALLISGVTGIVIGQALTPLSDKGLKSARRWKAYSRHLAAISKGRSSNVPAGQFDVLLPMAVAFGVALPWAKRLDRQGALGVPAWFQALAREDGRPNTSALVEMLSLANTAGAHVTGGAGGGAS